MIYFYSTEQDAGNVAYYKGLLFEDLLRQYLRACGFVVDVSRRKQASLEYDVHGKHSVDGRPVIGEAKALAETIGGKEVAAFVGKALPFLCGSPPYSALFLSVSPLSPEASDFLRNLASKTPYSIAVKCGEELESHIREALNLPSADHVRRRTERIVPVSATQHVVHTNRGTYVAVIGAGHEGAFDDRFCLVGASAAVVSDDELLGSLQTALPALQELRPVTDLITSPDELNAIPRREIPAGLITAGDWLDYRRPASLKYFVGRGDEMQRAGLLVTEARSGLVLEVKARSGVGKSSLLSVLAERWRTDGHQIELHDARDVQSREDVLRLVQRFLGTTSVRTFEDVAPALRTVTARLNGKSAIVLVDQFEATFQAPEVFTAYEYLGLCIARSGVPCCMVYSRKDDLLTTHDDMQIDLTRLRDLSESISLDDFSQAEASALIERAIVAGKTRLSPRVLAQILEFAQGFPWLLKRTLAHVFTVSAAGVSQTEMLSSGLHLSDLFEEELAELDEQERGYLTRIAAVLPATYQALARRFEDDPFLRPMLEKLTHRKLLRFSAGTYDTYNDVFKDFLLYERLPEQGQSELLRQSLVTVMKAFRSLRGANHIEPSKLSQQWEKPLTGTYNVLRDMRLAGLVSKTHNGWEVPEVVRQFEHQERLGEFVRQSVLRNRIVSALLIELEKSGGIQRRDVARWLEERFPFTRVRNEVWNQYATTLSDWMVRLNLAELDGDALTPWKGTPEIAKQLGNLAVSGRGSRPRKAVFVPSCNWVTIQSTWRLIACGNGNGMNLRRGEHAARQDLLKLGLVTEDAGKTFRVNGDREQFEQHARILLSGEPYSTIWAQALTGAISEGDVASSLGMNELAPTTRRWMIKKLMNWGRSLGYLPMNTRVHIHSASQGAGDLLSGTDGDPEGSPSIV